MWYGFDPELKRQLAFVRDQVARRHQPPTREWPIVVPADNGEPDVLLVIRERPDGALTAFLQQAPNDRRPTA
jgi:hypothetical protein